MKLPELLEITRLFFDRDMEGRFEPALFMQGLSYEAQLRFSKIKNPQAWIISVLNEFQIKNRGSGEQVKEDEYTEPRTYFDSVCEVIDKLCEIGVDYKEIDFYTANNIIYLHNKKQAVNALHRLRPQLPKAKRRQFDIFSKGIETKTLSYINQVIQNHVNSIEAQNG